MNLSNMIEKYNDYLEKSVLEITSSYMESLGEVEIDKLNTEDRINEIENMIQNLLSNIENKIPFILCIGESGLSSYISYNHIDNTFTSLVDDAVIADDSINELIDSLVFVASTPIAYTNIITEKSIAEKMFKDEHPEFFKCLALK